MKAGEAKLGEEWPGIFRRSGEIAGVGVRPRTCDLRSAISPLIFQIWNGLPVPNHTALKGLAKNVYDLGSHIIALMKNYADTLTALQENYIL